MSTLWSQMGRRRRRSMSSLKKEDIPLDPGVYALYRSGKPMYVGKAKSLQGRVWKNHSGRDLGMGSSAMRRNVAEHLGIATANNIKEGLYRVSVEDARRVRTWLDGCEIAWHECATEADAVELSAKSAPAWATVMQVIDAIDISLSELARAVEKAQRRL